MVQRSGYRASHIKLSLCMGRDIKALRAHQAGYTPGSTGGGPSTTLRISSGGLNARF